MVNTKDLQFQYPNGPSFRFPDFTLERSSVLLVLGESGKGKTTLLHLLAGLMHPSSGIVEVNSTDIAKLGSAALDSFRGRNIGIVFQQPLFVRSITILENLLLAQRLAGTKESRTLAIELLTELNVAEKADKLPATLSIGERQRTSIARALATKPAIVLADEPTSALDDKSCERVSSLLESVVTNHGASLIVVTHDKRLKDRFTNSIEL